MKVAFLGFLFFPYYSFTQVQEFVLTGELKDNVNQTADCGVWIFTLTGKFDIISYSDSSYVNKEITVLFFCPNEYNNPQLKKGKKYILKVTNNPISPFGELVENSLTLANEKIPGEKEMIWKANGKKELIWVIDWDYVKK